MFYGIIVYLYFVDNKHHKQPHIHIKYHDDEAAISIPDGELPDGRIPAPPMKLVSAWIEITQFRRWKQSLPDSLFRASTGSPPQRPTGSLRPAQ